MRILLALCLLPVLAQSEEGERLVAGVVLDQEGRPLAGAEVAKGWVFRTDGRQHTGAYAQTDTRGAFRIVVPAGKDMPTLVAYSKDESLAGVVQVSGDDAEHVVIRMAPAVKAEIRVRTARNGPVPEGPQATWFACLGHERLGPVVAQAVNWNGPLKCVLPLGKYDWIVSDLDSVMRRGKADLSRKGSSVMLDVILPPSFVARHLGKRLPEWTVTEARGVPLDAASLASFRGKWTFIEFWAFW